MNPFESGLCLQGLGPREPLQGVDSGEPNHRTDAVRPSGPGTRAHRGPARSPDREIQDRKDLREVANSTTSFGSDLDFDSYCRIENLERISTLDGPNTFTIFCPAL